MSIEAIGNYQLVSKQGKILTKKVFP